jgi:hypothetical protein
VALGALQGDPLDEHRLTRNLDLGHRLALVGPRRARRGMARRPVEEARPGDRLIDLALIEQPRRGACGPQSAVSPSVPRGIRSGGEVPAAAVAFPALSPP